MNEGIRLQCRHAALGCTRGCAWMRRASLRRASGTRPHLRPVGKVALAACAAAERVARAAKERRRARKSSTWSVPRRRSVTTVSPMSLATITRHSFSASPPWPARAEAAWSPQRERRLRGDGRPACLRACLPAACLAGLEAGWLAGWLGSASTVRRASSAQSVAAAMDCASEGSSAVQVRRLHGLSQPGRGLVHCDQLFATEP